MTEVCANGAESKKWASNKICRGIKTRGGVLKDDLIVRKRVSRQKCSLRKGKR